MNWFVALAITIFLLVVLPALCAAALPPVWAAAFFVYWMMKK